MVTAGQDMSAAKQDGSSNTRYGGNKTRCWQQDETWLDELPEILDVENALPWL